MINVKEITRDNKKFLIEQLNIYMRFVELNSSIKSDSVEIDKSVILELEKLGLINSEKDLELLTSIVGKDIFNKFLLAVNAKITEQIEEPVLDRLYK